MGNSAYTPFDNNPPKPAWDDSLLKHDIASYLQHLSIIACCWWMQKFFDAQEYTNAAIEIRSMKEGTEK